MKSMISNFKRKKTSIIFLLPVFYSFFILPANAQHYQSISEKADSNVLISQKSGLLSNGRYHEAPSPADEGSPFLFWEDFTDGELTIYNIRFTNQKLKYDAFTGNLILLYSDNSNTLFPIIPPKDFISSFKINGIEFKKISLPADPAFCQVIYEGEISSYLLWNIRRETNYSSNYVSYRYLNPKKINFLIIDEEIHFYKSRTDFLKIFPKEKQPQITDYLRQNRLKLQKCSPKELSGLIAYCEMLTEQ